MRSEAGILNQRSDFIVGGRWVSRDPCPLCGTRTDIGCRHFAPVSPTRDLPVGKPKKQFGDNALVGA